ncbi:anti-sigma B factor antagonist [Lipingzhangella halophila]|uniref:Anti-sigma factor antagonist n=1 Tax=Lipingzhangella halophila TaxID=1783352 RepID=A0A7W7W5V4_9ACTN|nr:STAS domain-containing protein [Lipingzhangella halophila]MBB4934200.1 anti-sigma B factor antagonist [Lipingzhangella halophila]
MHRLGLNTRVDNHSVIIEVEGDLDIATAGDLQEHVLSAVDEHGPWLILDLTSLDFMDSSGLNVVINIYRSVKERGGSLALAAPNERVTKVVRLVGLHRQVAVHRTVPAAVNAMEALEAQKEVG